MSKLLCEILSKCYEISTNTKADVFFDYAPHVNTFSVFVYRDGWTEETNGDMEYFAMSLRATRGNLITILAKLYDLEDELEVA